MTRDEVLKIANDMAFMACIWIDDEGNEVNDLVKFAKLVAAKEREACADLCATFYDEMWEEYAEAGNELAEIIRARGEV